MSLELRLWQNNALHAEMESIMKKHLSLVKEFSTSSSERKKEIIGELQKLRQQREQLLNQ